MGEFYGQSYLVDPRGQFVAIGSRDKDEVVIGDMDRRVIEEVRNTWQFYRDRRPGDVRRDGRGLASRVSDATVDSAMAS